MQFWKIPTYQDRWIDDLSIKLTKDEGVFLKSQIISSFPNSMLAFILRNEMTEIRSEFIVHNSKIEIAPLLFISLIENAFKHGMNSNAPATIDINMVQTDSTLVFTCDNTNNPKPSKDRSGSGIGLENTRRRLNLIYPNHYQWEQIITPENIYHIKITLEL